MTENQRDKKISEIQELQHWFNDAIHGYDVRVNQVRRDIDQGREPREDLGKLNTEADEKATRINMLLRELGA